MSANRSEVTRRKGGRRSLRKNKRPLVYAALVILLAGIVWCATLYFIIVRFNGEPDGSPLQKADVGIVLGASLWNNAPSPGLRERLDHALDLYQQGLYSHIIVSGGLDSGATVTEAEGMKRYLVGRGVPETAILSEDKSTSTFENLKFSRVIMKEQGWQTALIVTHNYHGSRSYDIARTLHYDRPEVSITDTKVMNLAYNRSREVLAYTKWLLQKWSGNAA